MTEHLPLPEYPNSLCRVMGHRWQKTLANYRFCDRDKCEAVERLTERGWVRVERRKQSRKHITTEPVTTLF
jgi:hypothetical protein